MQLAEVNIARPRYGIEDPRFAGFVDNLDRVNGIAERSPGFVWRLVGDADNAMDVTWPGAPEIIVNLSVWENAEALEHFVWNTVHKQVYKRRGEWFPALGSPHFVMWHVTDGHRPNVQEAHDRLEHYRRHGTSDHAFGWEGLPNLKRWMEERCA